MVMEDKTNSRDILPSPCVRNCCLDLDDICMGCFRHLDEIIDWQQQSNEQKNIIAQRCQQRRLQKR